MLVKRYIFSMIALVIFCICVTARCDSANKTDALPGEEWSWSRGAFNTFSGTIDLSEYIGKKLTIQIGTEMPFDKTTEQQSLPVFTSANGKRILMTKQSNEVAFIPDEKDSLFEYSVSFRFPEKERVTAAEFTFIITDQDGLEIKKLLCRIDNDEAGDGYSKEPFYIPVNIRTVTIVFCILAATIWMIIAVKNIIEKTGDK